MKNIDLRAGDGFCTADPMWLGRAIVSAQKFHAIDNHAVYSHTGTVIASSGVGITYCLRSE